MHDPETIRNELELVRRHDIEEYEAELGRAREGMARLEDRSRLITKRLQETAREHNVDLAALHAVHGDEDEVLAGYLEEIRPRLLDRPSSVEADLQIKAMYAPALDAAGVERAEPIGALMLAPDGSHFEGLEGERGNPWLTPTSGSGLIHIGQTFSGSGTGSGCWGVGYIYSPDVANVYYLYTPPKTGILSVQTWTILHGFWVARADDGCFTCKNAKAYARMQVSTVQNKIWQDGDSFTICDIDSGNVDTYGNLDKGIHLYTSRPVLSGSPVTIRVSVVVGTMAKGSGSYAEVDFKSKAKSGAELNYIWTPCVVVSYV